MLASLSDKARISILSVLPPRIGDALDDGTLSYAEEIRVRAGRPVQVVGTAAVKLLPVATEKDCADIFSAVCQHSLYAWEQELRQSFITLPGGCRVGVCGRALIDADGGFRRIGNVTSLNIRIPRQSFGAADCVMPYIKRGGSLNSVLVVAPPRGGKTTVLRDAARQLSYSSDNHRVCVIDERSELAGAFCGIPQNDLGPRCDVLDGCPKALGLMLALRAMSPDVLITDEIGTAADMEAVSEAALCGVAVLASAHGGSVAQVLERDAARGGHICGAFSYILRIQRRGERVEVTEVMENGKC